MSSGFGELTLQAHHLVSAGDLAGAQRLLADALADADPRPDHASPELADAAGLQARILVALGEPHSARGWAAFAYAAATRLHGGSDERTIAAAATLAAVLHRVGSDARAARLYSEVILELTAHDGPESLRVLAAHADLATVEYARGQCAQARERLQDAWELHREVYGDGHPSGIKMLARLGAMQRDCGRFSEAQDNLALARDLARQHLDAEDPLARQVTTLARSAADPDHVCDDEHPPQDPVPMVPAARTAPPDEGPPEPPTWPVGPATTDETYPPTVPGQRLPTEDADAGHPSGQHVDPWPSEPPAGPAYDPLPPAGRGPTGGYAEADGVYRVGDHDPARLLPVVVPRQQPPPRSRAVPLVVGGVAVVLLGTVAVIAGVAGVDGGEQHAPPPAPPGGTPDLATTPTTSGPTAVAAAPDQVRLTDRRDDIALSWRYPPGAEGPVVVAGGRAGQETRAFQELPAGTQNFVVYGLDRTNDYCFTIAVVWSTESVARSGQVCTKRR
ncbi:tetratricopeptide repeat protein [Micromonospora sp. KC723]|uniref:tetratricopeptide repeat protein n=1 Tax=Micromonospora sp. KC723 TaxID=2530381 RepID=UPI001046D043|nr:tetratricopeptide repeat protein [Micromonospora sp. KC723]TDB75572.1 tetratricopeptide repeat protein [Micromonospora sp. KC723]